MGVAVTDSEMRSALAWMPSAGDSFESIKNKTNLMNKEGLPASPFRTDRPKQGEAR